MGTLCIAQYKNEELPFQMSRNVTQKQIGQRLGISPGMVGRALRNDSAYSAETLERIQRVAQEMGYHQGTNQGARHLAGRRHGRSTRHGVIGILPFDTAGTILPYYARLHQGISRAAQGRGLEVMGLLDHASLGWECVDGLVGYGEKQEELARQLGPDLPYVSIGTRAVGCPAVLSDDGHGMRQAVSHLLDLGHERIGYLADPASSSMVKTRQEAYIQSLQTAGIKPLPQWQRQLMPGGAMEARGRLSMLRWLEAGFLKTGLTAIMVQNDRSAIGTMETLQAAGLRVPMDISVVGFDSTDECELCSPHLTSVSVPLEEMGAEALELLLLLQDANLNPNTIVTLPVHLEVRASSGPPPPS